MSRNACKIISIISLVIAIIGLVSYIGRISPVNIGAFIFPAVIGAVFLGQYIKKC